MITVGLHGHKCLLGVTKRRPTLHHGARIHTISARSRWYSPSTQRVNIEAGSTSQNRNL